MHTALLRSPPLRRRAATVIFATGLAVGGCSSDSQPGGTTSGTGGASGQCGGGSVSGPADTHCGSTVQAIVTRCESVEALADRTRTLKRELEERQQTLAATAQDLTRASELRTEAAASAQHLSIGADLTSDMISS